MAKLRSERESTAKDIPDYWRHREDVALTLRLRLKDKRTESDSAPEQRVKPKQPTQGTCICIYYGSPLTAAKAAASYYSSGKIKAVIQKTLQSNLYRSHNTLTLTTYLQCKIHVRVRIACMLSFVCMHVSTWVCVTSQSPLFHKVYFYLLFKSDSTVCISHLMWNRVPCSHGSM
jgi:hypothetical protein